MTLARQSRLLAFFPLLALSACASTFPSFSASSGRSSYLIGMEELQGNTFGSAFEAVENLRPQWMRTRSHRTLGYRMDIDVYMDRVAFGSLHALKSVPVESIERIEWIDAATAKQHWGTDHNAVIAIWTRP